jgi:hypothetical protein
MMRLESWVRGLDDATRIVATRIVGFLYYIERMMMGSLFMAYFKNHSSWIRMTMSLYIIDYTNRVRITGIDFGKESRFLYINESK